MCLGYRVRVFSGDSGVLGLLRGLGFGVLRGLRGA